MSVPRIRIGNDFKLNWEVELGGVKPDLGNVLSKKLLLKRFREVVEITEYKTVGNVVSIEFTPEMLPNTGSYILELHYVLDDITFADNDRKCAVDTDAFVIVARTADADDPSEFTITTDMAIGYQGKNAYEVWLETHEGTEEDYFTWLREPSVTAGAYATTQGDYALAQGNYAKAQGNYAKEQGEYVAGLQILNSVVYDETEYNEI